MKVALYYHTPTPPPFKNMPDLPMMQMCAINLFPIMWEMGLVCLTFCEFP